MRYVVNGQTVVEADYFEVDEDGNLLFYREQETASSVRSLGFRRRKGLAAIVAAGHWNAVVEG